MTIHRSNTPLTGATDADMPAELRMRLRALREDLAPPAHLWDAIDVRLDRVTVQAHARQTRRPVYALAAALAIAAIGGSWVWSTQTASTSQIAQSDRDAASDPGLRDALAMLDRDIREIREALRQDPTSRVLLQQLHRVDSIRFTLSRRITHG